MAIKLSTSKPQETTVNCVSPGDTETFNFEAWAKEVRRQLLATLDKRSPK